MSAPMQCPVSKTDSAIVVHAEKPHLSGSISLIRFPFRYPVFCKRPVVADGFYEALNQPNVTVVPLKGSSVDAFTTNGLRYLDGQETEFDDVIFCTGYQVKKRKRQFFSRGNHNLKYALEENQK